MTNPPKERTDPVVERMKAIVDECSNPECYICETIREAIAALQSSVVTEGEKRKGPTIASLKAAIERGQRDGPVGPALGPMTPAERNKYLFGSEDPALDALRYAYENGFRWPDRFRINRMTLAMSAKAMGGE